MFGMLFGTYPKVLVAPTSSAWAFPTFLARQWSERPSVIDAGLDDGTPAAPQGPKPGSVATTQE